MSGGMWPVSAIVLAAGRSRRMGENKLQMDFGGVPMLSRVLGLIDSLPFPQKILVADSKNIYNIKVPPCFEPVTNHAPEKGQSESVKLGVRAATGDYYMFFMGDMPLLDAATVRLLVSQIEDGRVVVPTSGGNRKNPVIFPKSLRDELLLLSGDTGGRAIFAAHPDMIKEIPISNEAALLDIDTPEAYGAAGKFRLP